MFFLHCSTEFRTENQVETGSSQEAIPRSSPRPAHIVDVDGWSKIHYRRAAAVRF